MSYRFTILVIGILIGFQSNIKAQFKLNGQIIVRGEFRNGYNRLIDIQDDATFFIGQRSRLEAGFERKKLEMYMSVQDVRVWGSTSQANKSDSFFSLHEGWAKYSFSDYWSIKLGRQVLNYDNARFLGSLDWALQGRSHDLISGKYEKGNMKLDMGLAYNQSRASYTATSFDTPNQYRAAQFIRFENKNNSEKFQYAFMIWNDGYEIENVDSNGTSSYDIEYRTILSMPTLIYHFGQSEILGQFYFMTAKDKSDSNTSDFDVALQFKQTLFNNEEMGTNLKMVVGAEWMTGQDIDDQKHNYFRVPYGTNHANNGYMDYFNVGAYNLAKITGMQDYFLKFRYSSTQKRYFGQIDVHYFNAMPAFTDNFKDNSSGLGTEIDLSVGYELSEDVSVQGGISLMLPTETMEVVSNTQDAKSTQQWAYLMCIFRPDNKNKFIGVSF